MYKWLNNKTPKALNDLFEINTKIHNYNTRNSQGPHLFHNKKTSTHKSFLVQAPKFWMKPPNVIKCVKNTKLFTRNLKISTQ